LTLEHRLVGAMSREPEVRPSRAPDGRRSLRQNVGTPIAEASEQTIIQRVVPFQEQGRVFGFAQSLETAASPITAFLIGPIAQFWVIPSMTDGGLADPIGSWFGTGPARGMALIFIVAGVIGLTVTVLALRSGPYRRLSNRYTAAPSETSQEAFGGAAGG
jgi:MFS transporter, DHA3 family, multidrug efflux protein